MRKTLIRIHSYLGLFCSPYLIVFGISSLNFNHPLFPVTSDNGKKVSWEKRDLAVPSGMENEDLANLVNDSLGIMGWYIPWDAVRDPVHFQYQTVHFGKKYLIDLSIPQQRVLVTETAEPAGNIIKGLHFLGEEIPGAPWWIDSWQYYQDLTVYGLVFWIITGLYFWLTKSTDLKWGNRILFGSMIISFLILVYVWLIG